MPRFISPAHGAVFAQSITLRLIQIAIRFSANLMIALSAAGMATWFARSSLWLAAQRYVMGLVLAAHAVCAS